MEAILSWFFRLVASSWRVSLLAAATCAVLLFAPIGQFLPDNKFHFGEKYREEIVVIFIIALVWLLISAVYAAAHWVQHLYQKQKMAQEIEEKKAQKALKQKEKEQKVLDTIKNLSQTEEEIVAEIYRKKSAIHLPQASAEVQRLAHLGIIESVGYASRYTNDSDFGADGVTYPYQLTDTALNTLNYLKSINWRRPSCE